MKKIRDILNNIMKISSKKSISILQNQLNIHQDSIASHVDLLGIQLLNHKYRNLYLVGVGKCSHIATSYTSSLNSVCINAIHISVSDFLHGGLNLVNRNDIMLYISNSGETSELIELSKHCKKKNVLQILVTNSQHSTLEYLVDETLILTQGKITELDADNIIPSTSNLIFHIFFNSLTIFLHENHAHKVDYLSGHPSGSLGK